jgi:diaminopimelate decarboxylase
MTPSPRGGDLFAYRAGSLHAESLALDELASRFGTPLYVYSRRAIEQAFDLYANALAGRPALVCYAMKANSNLAVLDVLARRGSGFDIVSGGELARVRAAGGDPARTVFSGVGKNNDEIAAALEAGILCFNVESAAELDRIDGAARAVGKRAPVSIRVNPDVDPGTHPYIATGLASNKFGVAYGDTRALYADAARRDAIEVVGIGCHIGSQITDVGPYVDAADRVLDLVDVLERDGITLRHIDFGGGLGIRYRDETPPPIGVLVRALLARVDARGHRRKTVILEPGRSIVGAAGVLLTRVEYMKPGQTKSFAIVDAAMNDLARPAMYNAWMEVVPVAADGGPSQVIDVVGPVCESGDWLARDRSLAVGAGDLLAILGAGAYGMAMSSNYNSRGRAAEVLVDGNRACLVRSRETAEQLFAGESRLP